MVEDHGQDHPNLSAKLLEIRNLLYGAILVGLVNLAVQVPGGV